MGLWHVWRTPFFWLGLATIALLGGTIAGWYRSIVHTVERHGDELVLRRLGRAPVRRPIPSITRLSVLDATGAYRGSMGDWWEMPVGRVRLTFDDGTTVGTDRVLTARVLTELLTQARPDLEVRHDLAGEPQRFTYELGTDTRIVVWGNNRLGPLLLMALAGVGFLGFASVMAWAEARPDTPGGSPVRAARAAAALAATHPVDQSGTSRCDVTDCDGSHRRYLWWDGDATTHRISGIDRREVAVGAAAAIRARAAALGVTGPASPRRTDLVDDLDATVDGVQLELQVYATATADRQLVAFVARTPCLRGPQSSASATTQRDLQRLATWVVYGS